MAKRVTVKIILTMHDMLTREMMTESIKKTLTDKYPRSDVYVHVQQEDRVQVKGEG